MLPIGIFFGTRPEYLKLKPLVQLLELKGLPFTLLQVLQHENLTIDESDKSYYHKVVLDKHDNCSRLTQLASEISKQVEPFVQKVSCVFVQGDTATAFFTALSAFHHQKPIFHIEAGLRTYDLDNPFPEEAYRTMISRIATYHLCPDEQAKKHLLQEHITQNIYVVGNTILDLVKSYQLTSQIGNKVLITVHRRENWEQMSDIVLKIHALASVRNDLHFIWIYHPNPSLKSEVKKTAHQCGLLSNLQFEEPCSHQQLCEYIHDAYCIITDSGGIQEEASFVGKFSFVIRKTTERSSIPSEYLEIVEKIDYLIPLFQKKNIQLLPPCTVYGNGNTSEKIVQILQNLNLD